MRFHYWGEQFQHRSLAASRHQVGADGRGLLPSLYVVRQALSSLLLCLGKSLLGATMVLGGSFLPGLTFVIQPAPLLVFDLHHQPIEDVVEDVIELLPFSVRPSRAQALTLVILD